MSLDIVPADKEKWYLRIAMNWFIKKYSGGKNSKDIHEEMQDCGNPVIRYFSRLKNKIVNDISERHHTKMIEQFTEFLLWIMYKDTAYRQIFFYALKHMMDNKETLMPIIESYYREPQDWYVNRWSESKKITKKKREKGEIGEWELSEAEKYFVPTITHQLIEQELEREAKKRGY